MADKEKTIEETVETATVNEAAEDVQPEQATVSEIDDSDLARYVEAMIFSSASPLPSAKISQALNCGGVGRIKKAIASLNQAYETSERAFRIRQVAGGYQYYVLPQWSDCLKKLFTKTRKIRLTKAALETMAVVAYKQPVSKNQIEFVRGVASDGVLHNLLEKNLIRISGRSEGAGRSLLYSATEEFLKFFGLNSFDDLPRIAEIEELIQQMEVERAENLEKAVSAESVSDEMVDIETASATDDSGDNADSDAEDIVSAEADSEALGVEAEDTSDDASEVITETAETTEVESVTQS